MGKKIVYSIAPVNGATGYYWLLSGGGNISTGQNTNSTSIDWGTQGNFILSVVAINSCDSIINQNIPITVSPATGIIDPDDIHQITVIPNPSPGEFYLTAKGLINKSIGIEVMNILGQTIYLLDQRVTVNDFNKMIDLRKMSDGMYYIKISVDKKVYVRKILKQE